MTKLLDYVLNHGESFRRARLPSLYSDFSLQCYSNPDGYAANVAVWEEVLTKAAKEGLMPPGPDGPEFLSLRMGDELLQLLETKEWGKPLALGKVIDEAVSRQHMIPMNKFMSISSSIYDQKWLFRHWWPLSWGLPQLGFGDNTSSAKDLRNGQYVIIRNLEEVTSRILSHSINASTVAERIYSRGMFRKKVEQAMNLDTRVTDSDFSVILTYLSRYKGVIIYDDDVVKFKTAETGTSQMISSEDKAICSLRSLIHDLNLQVDFLSSRLTELVSEAKAAANTQLRSSALRALRSKKTIERTLSQRLETLSLLETVYQKIEQATDQIAVARVIESSTGVLRKLNAEVGSIEKVDDLMEGLREEISKVDEVSQAIEQGGQPDSTDQQAIDEELDALMQQAQVGTDEKAAEETQKRLAGKNLSVPPSAAEVVEPKKTPSTGLAPYNAEEAEHPKLAEDVNVIT